MPLSERHVRLALFCVGEELRARQAGKAPVLRWLHELVRALECELAVSQSRQPGGDEPTDSNRVMGDQVGTAEAARILGWSRRRVQRRAADLSGYPVAGRYLFDRDHIQQIAEESTDGRHIA